MDDLDRRIRQDIQSALEFQVDAEECRIGVFVDRGIVTLLGEVRDFSQRWSAERLTRDVPGVRAVANGIQVRLPIVGARSDGEIARDVSNMLASRTFGSPIRLQPTVTDGWVLLTGDLHSQRQKTLIESMVRRVPGVDGVVSNIRIFGGHAYRLGSTGVLPG